MKFSFILLFLLSLLQAEEPLRTWTSTDGRTIEGQFVESSDDAVTTKRKDGHRVEVPLKLLSAGDVKVVLSRNERRLLLPGLK